MPRVAIVQAVPPPFDAEASCRVASQRIEEAAACGAKLVAFGETWLGTYPAWIDHWPRFGLWDDPVVKSLHARYRRSCVTVPGPEVDEICAAAARHGVAVVTGVSERVDDGPGRGTLYNALLVIDAAGTMVVHHRKLVPTYTERLIWGSGDGHGLRTVQTQVGRVGGLICWEHWMPLARQALHLAGEDVHVALWPTVHDRHALASRHYAFEGRCFVLAVGSVLHVDHLPAELTSELQGVPSHGWLMRGGSTVFAPDGDALFEPIFDREDLRVVDLPTDKLDEERMSLDVAGHYARPDVFTFEVDRANRRDFPERDDALSGRGGVSA